LIELPHQSVAFNTHAIVAIFGALFQSIVQVYLEK
jgi:hypothetical protein